MWQELIVVFFFLSTLTGCASSITSETGTLGAAGPGGAFWYVRDGVASSRVFYCPPQTQVGPHRCMEAEIVDYANVGASVPLPQMTPPQMAPPQMMPPQMMQP